MKRRKAISIKSWLLCLFSLLSVLFFAAGCGKQEESAQTKTAPPAYAYSVTDSQGYELRLEKKPQRIVSLSISTDEIWLDLVDAERIVALTYLADDAGISNVTEKAKKVKGRVQRSNAEALVAMQPDLIVIPDFTSKDDVDLLRTMKLNVYVYKTPTNIEEIKRSVQNIGAAVGENERAQAVAQAMEARLELVKAKLAKLPLEKEKSVVFMQSNGAYYRRDMTFNDICRNARVKNALDGLNYDGEFLASQEEIVSLNPDVFVLAGWNYNGAYDAAKNEEALLADTAYSGVTAVKNKAVYTLPAAHLLSTSQYIVDAVADMARAVYGAEV